MSELLLNRLLCEEIDVEKCINWLKTDEDLNNQFPCTRADFVIYFTNYLRSQTECVLRSTSTVTGDSLLHDTKLLAESPLKKGENFNIQDTTNNTFNCAAKDDISQNVYHTKDVRKRVSTRLFHEDVGQNNRSNPETTEVNYNNQISINENLSTPRRDILSKSLASNLETTPNNLSNRSDKRYAVSTPLKASIDYMALDTSLFETPIKNSAPTSNHLLSPIGSGLTDVRMLGMTNFGYVSNVLSPHEPEGLNSYYINRNVNPQQIESFHYGYVNRNVPPYHPQVVCPVGAMQRQVECNPYSRKSCETIENHSSPSSTISDGMFDNSMSPHRNVAKDIMPCSTAKSYNANINLYRNTKTRPNVYVADFINSASMNTAVSSNNTHGGKKKRHVKYVNMSLDEDLMNKKMFSSDKAETSNARLNIKDSDMFPEIGSKRRDVKQSYNSNRRINPTRLNSTNPDSENSERFDSNSLNSKSGSQMEVAEFGVKYHEKIEQNEAFKSVHNFKTAEHGNTFQEERSILKKEREKVMEKFSLLNHQSEKMTKIQSPLIISKQAIGNIKVEITFIKPDPAKVLDLKMLNILADVYDAMLDFNLIVNVTSEIYFLISLIVSQQIINTSQDANIEDKKIAEEDDSKSIKDISFPLEDVQKSIENINFKDIVDTVKLSNTNEWKDASRGSVTFIPAESIADSAMILSIKPVMSSNPNVFVKNINKINHSHLPVSKDTDRLGIDKENIDINSKPTIRILKRLPSKIPEESCIVNNTVQNNDTSTGIKNDVSLANLVSNTAVSIQSDDTLLSSYKLLKTVHDCVYFALATLYRQKSSLCMFLDKSCLRILLQSDRVKQFLPPFVDVLNKLQNDNFLLNDKEYGFGVPEISNKNVYFFTETDSVDNFPVQQNFFSFKKQRDSFYEIFRCWEANHASGDNFAYKMETQVQRLIALDYSPANMSHLARLFRDQLLATCATAHKENSLEALAKLQSAIGSQFLSHNRLSKLSERLTGALPGQKSDTEIFTPPNFDKEQAFFRDFIIYASASNFRVHLIDSFVQAIVKLDQTAFPCLEREDNGTQVDGETKSQFLQCVKSLQILGKFLGFAMALPYCERAVASQTRGNNSDKNLTCPPTEKVLTGEIAVRSWTQPPINLTAHLNRSLKDRRLVLTVPWLLQVIAMLDYTSLRLPYFKTLINQLFYIYIKHLFVKSNQTMKKISVKKQSDSKISKNNDCMSKYTRLILKISIGWLFDLPNFPKDMFYDYLRTFKNTSTVVPTFPNSNLLLTSVENDSSKKKSSVQNETENVIAISQLDSKENNKKNARSNDKNSPTTESTSSSIDIQTCFNTLNINMIPSINKPSSNISNNGDEIMSCDIVSEENLEEIEAFASLDCLSLVDKDVITELCPYLKHLRNLLASGVSNKISSGDDNTNTFRHITPVTSGLDGQAAKRKEAELQSQLEEWFLRSQPSGTRRITQLVSERVGSALTGMARSQLPAHRERVTKETHLLIIDMNEKEDINVASLCGAVARLREEKSKAFVKRCVRAATILGKSRCQSALSGLLPYDIPDTAAKQLVYICTRRACNLLKRVLNDELIYLTDIPTEVKRLCRIGLPRRHIMEMKRECLEADRILDEIFKDCTASSAVWTASRKPETSTEYKHSTPSLRVEDKENKEIVKFDEWFKSAFDAIVELKEVIIAIISGDLEQSDEITRIKNSIESARACSQCSYIDLVTKKTIAQLCLDLAIMIISTHPLTLKEFFNAFATIWKHCLFSGNIQIDDSCQINDVTNEEMSLFTSLVYGASNKNIEKTKTIIEKSKSSPEKKSSVSLRSGKKTKNKKSETANTCSVKESDTVSQCSVLNINTAKDVFINDSEIKYDTYSSQDKNISIAIQQKHKKSNCNTDDLIGNSNKASTNRSLQNNDNSASSDNTTTPINDRDELLEELPENEFFGSILCSRNLAILNSSNSRLLVWEALSDFIIFLLDNKFLSEDSLTEQCLALYRQEWPQIVLQNLALCIRLVSEKRLPAASDARFNVFLQFLSEFCHNLDQEFF